MTVHAHDFILATQIADDIIGCRSDPEWDVAYRAAFEATRITTIAAITFADADADSENPWLQSPFSEKLEDRQHLNTTVLRKNLLKIISNKQAEIEICSDIVPDEKITDIHGNANFGSMSPRLVVNQGVLKEAFGYQHGFTARTILMEHGLIRQSGGLTKKGFKYLRALRIYHFAEMKLD